MLVFYVFNVFVHVSRRYVFNFSSHVIETSPSFCPWFIRLLCISLGCCIDMLASPSATTYQIWIVSIEFFKWYPRKHGHGDNSF